MSQYVDFILSLNLRHFDRLGHVIDNVITMILLTTFLFVDIVLHHLTLLGS